MKERIYPIQAAYYNSELRRRLPDLALRDLDSAQNLWGKPDSTLAFRNVLVGSTQQRREIWQSWLENQIIQYDDRPSLYLLAQTFQTGTKTLERRALICALKIEDPNIIIHEDVVAEGVERARQSMEACEGDMAPIFVGYREERAADLRASISTAMQNQAPLLDYIDPTGDRHTVWEIKDPGQINQWQRYMREEKLYLLDGHHRLAAAKSNLKEGLGDGKILACLCSLATEDTLILPIHRVANYSRWMIEDRCLEDWATLGVKVSLHQAVNSREIERQIASLTGLERKLLLLHAHSSRLVKMEFPQALPHLPELLRGLAISHLEYYLEKNFEEATLIPVGDPKMALEQLALEQAQVAFFLPALQPSQVKSIASAALRLPRKSTRFVPKPALGLIMRPWES